MGIKALSHIKNSGKKFFDNAYFSGPKKFPEKFFGEGYFQRRNKISENCRNSGMFQGKIVEIRGGGYFLGQKFLEKIFASNCRPVYAKKGPDGDGRGFRRGLPGPIPPAYGTKKKATPPGIALKKKSLGGLWLFTPQAHPCSTHPG